MGGLGTAWLGHIQYLGTSATADDPSAPGTVSLWWEGDDKLSGGAGAGLVQFIVFRLGSWQATVLCPRTKGVSLLSRFAGTSTKIAPSPDRMALNTSPKLLL